MDIECVIFYGREGEPCEAFIRAVRKAAFLAGKSRDDTWMADFAATCLDGSALRYYETLSPDAQGSWRQLRQALLTNYPPIEPSDAPLRTEYSSGYHIPTVTPAASLPPRPRRGRIKVIGQNSTSYGYIGDGDVVTTSCLGSGASVSEALIVTYTPTVGLYEVGIERRDSRKQLLGLRWSGPSPSTVIGSSDYAALTAFDCHGCHRSSSMQWSGPGYTEVWRVAPDDTLRPHLGEYNGYASLRFFSTKTSQNQRYAIHAAADAGAFMTKEGTNWTPANLIFEEAQ